MRGEVYDALGAQLSSDLAVGSSALPLLMLAGALAIGAIALLLTGGRAARPGRR